MKKIYLLSMMVFFVSTVNIHPQDLTPDQIFEKVNNAIVVVYSYDFEGNKHAQGSGIILNELGILVTNYHIFAGCDKIELKRKDTVINHSGILGISIEKDILILRLADDNYPSIPVCMNDTLRVGQKVYAIGSPMGFENTMSEGIISGLRAIGKSKKNFIQITTPLSPGSSGGAVLNSKGELIGISSMGINGGENLNFAIPIKEILKVNSGQITDKRTLKALEYFYKGYNQYESGMYEEALENYNKYIEISKNEAKAYNYRGLVEEELQKYPKAIEDFTRAITLDNKFIAAYSNRAECYTKMDSYEQAEKDFSSVIKLDPKNFYAYYARGLVYSKDEDYNKSINDFTKAIKLDPDYVYSYINRGFDYYKLEKYEEAIDDWLKAIKIDPGYEKSLRPYINNADILRQLSR
jgi:tetratricopeptide (TPR) repeat protein